MSLAFATNGSLAHEVALVADENDRLVLVECEYVLEYVDGYVEAGTVRYRVDDDEAVALHHTLAENLTKIGRYLQQQQQHVNYQHE